MKIRAIELHNVRRFTDPVRIDNFGDGLNVLCEANEFGKSTIFDSLHAVFFTKSGSTAKDIKALRPHSGGPVSIGVEVETGGEVFTIRKRWFSKAETKVFQGASLIAQADAAEDWISRLLGQDGTGPAGLVWVRQGITDLGTGAKDSLEARRDLMSSVSEEVELMTGGRRMDAALKRCEEDLAVLATNTGKARAGGPWKAAEDRVAELTERRNALQTSADQLAEALRDRTAARKRLASLNDPDEAEARKVKLAEAKAAFEAATKFADDLEGLQRKADLAKLTHQQAAEKCERVKAAMAEHETAKRLVMDAVDKANSAEAKFEDALEADDAAKSAVDIAAAATTKAAADLRRAERAASAQESAVRRAEIEARIKAAEDARTKVETTAAAITGPDAKALQKVEDLSRAVANAIAIRDASAPNIVAHYDSGTAFNIDGQDIENGKLIPISRNTRIMVPGVGSLDIRPPESGNAAQVAAAEAALRSALEALGAETIEETRARAASRQNAEAAHREAKVTFSALAPDGIDAIRAQLAKLPEPEEADGALDLDAAKEALEAAQATEKELRSKAETTRHQLGEATNERGVAQANLNNANDRLARALAVLPEGGADQEHLQAEAEKARRTWLTLDEECQAKAASAPDLEMAKASYTRLQSADEMIAKDIAALEAQILVLNERIKHASGDAVEEELAETAQELEVAEATLRHIVREVAVLQRLKAALTGARTEARDRYFAPVAKELRPLLNLLWPEAELEWSEDNLLPTSLKRGTVAEDLSILSGGTQEQIALLVRLAFARMLSNAGRSAPVILDDALVFTDDDRIERMFDALHRQASDIQIIVLTCRQRAFRDLGGQMLTQSPAQFIE